MRTILLTCAMLLLTGGCTRMAIRDRPGVGTNLPKHYVCRTATGPIVIDGRLDDAAWQDAPWTDPFVDIEGDS